MSFIHCFSVHSGFGCSLCHTSTCSTLPPPLWLSISPASRRMMRCQSQLVCNQEEGSWFVEIRTSCALWPDDRSRREARGPLVNMLHTESLNEKPLQILIRDFPWYCYFFIALQARVRMKSTMHYLDYVWALLPFHWIDQSAERIAVLFYAIYFSLTSAELIPNLIILLVESKAQKYSGFETN